MEKKYSLMLATLITLIIALDFYSIRAMYSPNHKELVKVIRAIDGDTFETEDGRIIRLLNINTPEKGEKGYKEASAFLKELENTTVGVELTGIDKYKRSLAKVYSPDYINLKIIQKGLANKFLVDSEELKEFNDAENYAIKNSLGLWAKSDYFGCFDSEIKEKEETIILTNNCKILNIEGWRIKDEGRKVYKFQSLNLSIVKIHSEKGEDNATDIFMHSASPIWNNDRDTLYLFDKEGKLAYHETYGY
jgi:endonuclease YncB( thermonuclease family)